jgi:hypothetical protein
MARHLPESHRRSPGRLRGELAGQGHIGWFDFQADNPACRAYSLSQQIQDPAEPAPKDRSLASLRRPQPGPAAARCGRVAHRTGVVAGHAPPDWCPANKQHDPRTRHPHAQVAQTCCDATVLASSRTAGRYPVAGLWALRRMSPQSPGQQLRSSWSTDGRFSTCCLVMRSWIPSWMSATALTGIATCLRPHRWPS